MHTLLPGLRVGHATDLALGSGVTAIVFERPCLASVCVLGGAPGGHDLGMLDPSSSIERIDAVVLAGGSAFGLDAAAGVQAALREAKRGESFAGQRVPLVAGAILFDLANGAGKDWGRFPPYRDLGYAAALAAGDSFVLGSVGAGAGAMTATCKGGTGAAQAVSPHGHTVAALAAVNAMGSAIIGEGPHFWAAPFERDGEFGGLGWPAAITAADLAYRAKHPVEAPATTIGVIATDAALTRAQAHRLAIMAHDGLARAVLPAHAPMDGDTIFAVSTGARVMGRPVAELTELGHLATQVFARAVARGVFEATALPHEGAQKSWHGLFAGA